MTEKVVVEKLVTNLRQKGYKVATEVANFYRSADIAVIDSEDKVWIIECKLSKISHAIQQLKTHRLSADKVFIGTISRRTKSETLDRIKAENVGLIYVDHRGNIKFACSCEDNVPWAPARNNLYRRIMDAT